MKPPRMPVRSARSIRPHLAPQEERVEGSVAQALRRDAVESRGISLAPGRRAVAHVDHLHEGLRIRRPRLRRQRARVAQRRAEIAGAVRLDVRDEVQRGLALRGGGGHDPRGVVGLVHVGGDDDEAVARAQLAEHGAERVEGEGAALQGAARGVAHDHHRARARPAGIRERGVHGAPARADVDRGVDPVRAALLDDVGDATGVRDGDDDLAGGPVVLLVHHGLAPEVEAEGGDGRAHLRRSRRVDVGVTPEIAAQRRHVADHDALVALRLDGKDAQLEGAPVLPLEQRRVAHLVDDGFVGLPRLVDLDELAIHHLAVDLHGEAHQRGILRERKAEGALEPLGAVVVEDVLDPRLREIAGEHGRGAHAAEGEAGALVLCGLHLQRADPRGLRGAGASISRANAAAPGSSAMGTMRWTPSIGRAHQHVVGDRLSRVFAGVHGEQRRSSNTRARASPRVTATTKLPRASSPRRTSESAAEPDLGARIGGAADHHGASVDRAQLRDLAGHAAARGERREARLVGGAGLDVAGDERHREAERPRSIHRGRAPQRPRGAAGHGEREDRGDSGDPPRRRRETLSAHGFTSMAATRTVCLGLNRR